MNIEKKIWKKYQSKGFPHISDPMIIDEIISDIDKIKKDLLKIAEKGELEQLRLEVERYFKN